MLILNLEMWDKYRIIKISCSNNWESNDVSVMVDCVLNEVKQKAIEMVNLKEKCILILDCCKGKLPPIFQFTRIFSFLLNMSELISKSLNYTVLYSKSDNYKQWFDLILTMYKPIRPIHIIQSSEELKKLILNSNTNSN